MKFPHLNTIQAISFTGVITSLASQAILYVLGKEVDNFWMVYPCWAAFFLLGTVLRYSKFGQIEEHDHHGDHQHSH
jgi:hypothetical protein